MTIDLDALEFRAVVATPGPWKNVDTPTMSVRDEIHNANGARIAMALTTRHPRDGEQFIDFDQAEANAAYIAAVSPDVVLELIAELRAERERYTNAVKAYKAVVQEGEWLAFQVHKPRKRCPPLQECDNDDIVTEKDCQQCWLNAAREAVEVKK